jgi:hypothetical protein
MTLNFPNAPTNGQVFQGYQYNTAKGVWARTNFSALEASTTNLGIVELATNAETLAGTDATRAVTPAALGAFLPGTTGVGLGKAFTPGRGSLDVSGQIFQNDGQAVTSVGHQHDATAITSGILPSDRLRPALRTQAQEVFGDWNSHTQTGFYDGNALLNRPPGTDWLWVTVNRHSQNADWVVQQATEFFGTQRTWIRTCYYGDWQQWKEVRTGADIAVVQVDTVIRTATASWTFGPTFDTIFGFKPNSKVKLFYHVPSRNQSGSWGGIYIEPQVSWNGQAWQSLGSTGFENMVLNGEEILTYNNTLLLVPGFNYEFSARFRFVFQSYDGTTGWGNFNRNLNSTSGTAPMMTGNNGNQHYPHIIVEEIRG